MNYLLSVLLLCCLLTKTVQSQTTNELNYEAALSFQKTDKELNVIYQQILAKYAEDLEFIAALKKAQRQWILFRDAEVLMKYPNRKPGWYGTLQPSCVAHYKSLLTQTRINTLKTWLIGIEEGDICIGSVKKKE